MKITKSKKPGKKRKALYVTPIHRRRKMMASSLSDELSKKYKRRSLPVRKGDKVKVLRGDDKGLVGEVLKLDTTEYMLYLDGLTLKKTSGEDVPKPINPSNVMITSLYLEDKERRAMLERKLSSPIEEAGKGAKKEEAKKTAETKKTGEEKKDTGEGAEKKIER